MNTYRIPGTYITRKSEHEYTHAVIRPGQKTGKAYAMSGSFNGARKALARLNSLSSLAELNLIIVEVVKE